MKWRKCVVQRKSPLSLRYPACFQTSPSFPLSLKFQLYLSCALNVRDSIYVFSIHCILEVLVCEAWILYGCAVWRKTLRGRRRRKRKKKSTMYYTHNIHNALKILAYLYPTFPHIPHSCPSYGFDCIQYSSVERCWVWISTANIPQIQAYLIQIMSQCFCVL